MWMKQQQERKTHQGSVVGGEKYLNDLVILESTGVFPLTSASFGSGYQGRPRWWIPLSKTLEEISLEPDLIIILQGHF